MPHPHTPRPAALTPRPVLSRLSAFVPRLAEANQTLAAPMQHRPAHEFDVEHVATGEEGEEGAHVAMDLACGVLELHTEEAAAAAEAALAGGGLAAGVVEGESSDESDSESDSDDEEEEPAEPPPGKKRTRIEELK